MTGKRHVLRDAAIVAAHKAGVSPRALAVEHGITRQQISNILKQRPLPPRNPRPPVVAPELAAQIREEYETGRISIAKLIKRHGLTQHHIQVALGTLVPGPGKRRQLFLSP